jgi:hypothetical protein
MWLWLIVVAIIAVIGVILVFKSGPNVELLLAHAREAEQDSRHEDACYHYAILAAVGGAESREWADKVRALWREHGPFTFESKGEEMRSGYCSKSESCGEGCHRGVVGDVQRILGRDERDS